MTIDIHKNEDGTYRLEIDYTLMYSNASFGEVIGDIVDHLKKEDDEE